MHMKFLDLGTGSARAALIYNLQEHDHTGKPRESVEVLRGNPEMVTQIADSLDFVHKYRSAVIAWHKDDKPTLNQMNEVLDEVERVAFAGLESDQYSFYAVLHDKDHIHIIVPRVELRTRKSMNIAPPGWQKTYDLIRDKFNEKYGWAKPDDLSRKRLVNNSLNIHVDMKVNEAKKMVNDTVSELVTAGKLQDRDDVHEYLAHFGEITRDGKDYISLKPNGFKKAFKLKGAVYERDFEFKRVIQETRAKQRERATRGEADRDREVARIESVIEKVIGERAEYVRSRYGRETHQPEKTPVQDQKADLQRTEARIKADRRRSFEPSTGVKPSQDTLLASTFHSWAIADDRSFGWALGIRRFDLRPQPSTQTTKRANRERRRDEESVRQSRHDRERLQKRDRVKEEATSVAVGHGNVDSTVWRVDYDAVRTRVKRRIEATERAFQERVRTSYEPIRSQLTNHRQSVSEYHRRAEKHHRESERIIQDQVAATEQSAITELRSNATVIDKQVSTLTRVTRGIRGWFEKVGKSIQGVKNELVKLKLFKQAKEQVVSRERPKISLTPRR